MFSVEMFEAALLVLIIEMGQFAMFGQVVASFEASVKGVFGVGLSSKTVSPQFKFDQHFANIIGVVLGLANVPSIGIFGMDWCEVIEIVASTFALLQSWLVQPSIKVVVHRFLVEVFHSGSISV